LAIPNSRTRNDYTLDFELNPIIHINDWINFFGSIVAEVSPTGVESLTPNVANVEIFPFGWEVPVEVVAGLFDEPFGDFFETQYVNWINPFITSPLLYGAETFVPENGLGVQVRGGIQWGRPGQDVDYTLWSDSGPTFESAPGFGTIPKPVTGRSSTSWRDSTSRATARVSVHDSDFIRYPSMPDWDASS